MRNFGMKFFWILASLTFSSMVFSDYSRAAGNQVINFSVEEKLKYAFPETESFPATLKISDVDFKDYIVTHCTKAKFGNIYSANYANVTLASGRTLKDVPLRASGKITSFKWGKDGNGENILNIVLTCNKSGKLPVIASSTYIIGYSYFSSGGRGNSPTYNLETLARNKWNVSLKLSLEQDFVSDQGFIWTPKE
ncbi:hypothetical protein MCEMRE195_00017 [Candidatus Nanopelagicaceae bacterium]